MSSIHFLTGREKHHPGEPTTHELPDLSAVIVSVMIE